MTDIAIDECLTETECLTPAEISHLLKKLANPEINNVLCFHRRNWEKVYKFLWEEKFLIPGKTNLAFSACAINQNDYTVTEDGKLINPHDRVEDALEIFKQYPDDKMYFMYVRNCKQNLSGTN